MKESGYDQEIAERITKNLRTAIETSGKLKREIAEAAGISNAVITQYISGRSQPSLPTLHKLCRVLDVTPDDIIN